MNRCVKPRGGMIGYGDDTLADADAQLFQIKL